MVPDNRVDTTADGFVTKMRKTHHIDCTLCQRDKVSFSVHVQLATKCTNMSRDDDVLLVTSEPSTTIHTNRRIEVDAG